MSSTVNASTRETGSATLVIGNFIQLIDFKSESFKMNGLTTNTYFGIHSKTVKCYQDYVSFCLLSYYSIPFKFKATVSILNIKGEKLFSKECSGDFRNKVTENHFSLMTRSELLSRENGYLYHDMLTLLCEIEVIKDGQESGGPIHEDFCNLSENFQSLLTDGKFADFTLIVGKSGKNFRVHKAILSARSSVFAAMFEHDCEEKRQNKVNITDMDEEVCAEMMSYIYTGKVKELEKYAMELLVAADKYQLHSLKSICEQFMCSNLSVETVSNVLIMADLHQTTALKTKCIEYICANIDQVESTDGWKQLDTNVKLVKELFICSAKKK